MLDTVAGTHLIPCPELDGNEFAYGDDRTIFLSQADYNRIRQAAPGELAAVLASIKVKSFPASELTSFSVYCQ